MTSLFQITKELLASHNLHPKKRLGQNFLIDQQMLDRIISAAGLSPEDCVLEIGTGLGVLTQALTQKVKHVTTLDPDKDMIQIAKEVLSKFDNIEFIAKSFLDWVPVRPYSKVVANVPYYITTPIIERLLNVMRDVPIYRDVMRIILTVQKEVAERIVAEPGGKRYGSFSVFVQNRADAEIESIVPRKAFYPAPNVDSAILVLRPLPQLRFNIKEDIVRAAFSQRRKMLKSTLKKFNIDFERAGIDPRRRAETLGLLEFEKISALV